MEFCGIQRRKQMQSSPPSPRPTTTTTTTTTTRTPASPAQRKQQQRHQSGSRKKSKEKNIVDDEPSYPPPSRCQWLGNTNKNSPHRNILVDIAKLGLLVHKITERELYTLATVLLHLVAATAGINTTFTPAGLNTTFTSLDGDEVPDDYLDPNELMTTSSDLVVCLPRNSTDCTLYVKTQKNGLIELNESIYPALKAFHGYYDFRIIARINAFWLKFEPAPDSYYNTMAILYMVIFFVGTTGNGLVIYMFARCKTLRSSPYMLVLNLAISDFMIVFKCPVAAFNNYMKGPALGDWGCRIYGFIGGFSGTASIIMLTVIAVDRYSVVVNPLNPRRINYNTKYYACTIGFVWLYALFFSSIPLIEIGLSRYVPEGYFTTCSFDYLDTSTEARIFMFVFFICAWAVPLSIICYCYFHILNVVFAKHNAIQSNKNKQKIEIRLAIVVLMVILLWFLSWTPYSIVAICGIFGYEEYLTPTRAMIPALFCKSASCLNPFLYTISHKRFRSELLRLFCRRQPRLHYSITRSSLMTKSSRRQRNVVDLQGDMPARILTAGSLRARNTNNSGSFYGQRQYSLRRHTRSCSTPESLISTASRERYGRSLTHSTISAEERIVKLRRSPSSTRSIIAGQDGNRIYVIDSVTEPEEDVIFIVSGGGITGDGCANLGRSNIRQSISTQVFVLHSDSNGATMDCVPATLDRMETSF